MNSWVHDNRATVSRDDVESVAGEPIPYPFQTLDCMTRELSLPLTRRASDMSSLNR